LVAPQPATPALLQGVRTCAAAVGAEAFLQVAGGFAGRRLHQDLARRIAVDFDGHTRSAAARTRHPNLRSRRHAIPRCGRAGVLIVIPAQSRVRCGQHYVERGGSIVREVQSAGGIDIRFNPP